MLIIWDEFFSQISEYDPDKFALQILGDFIAVEKKAVSSQEISL